MPPKKKKAVAGPAGAPAPVAAPAPAGGPKKAELVAAFSDSGPLAWKAMQREALFAMASAVCVPAPLPGCTTAALLTMLSTQKAAAQAEDAASSESEVESVEEVAVAKPKKRKKEAKKPPPVDPISAFMSSLISAQRVEKTRSDLEAKLVNPTGPQLQVRIAGFVASFILDRVLEEPSKATATCKTISRALLAASGVSSSWTSTVPTSLATELAGVTKGDALIEALTAAPAAASPRAAADGTCTYCTSKGVLRSVHTVDRCDRLVKDRARAAMMQQVGLSPVPQFATAPQFVNYPGFTPLPGQQFNPYASPMMPRRPDAQFAGAACPGCGKAGHGADSCWVLLPHLRPARTMGPKPAA